MQEGSFIVALHLFLALLDYGVVPRLLAIRVPDLSERTAVLGVVHNVRCHEGNPDGIEEGQATARPVKSLGARVLNAWTDGMDATHKC